MLENKPTNQPNKLFVYCIYLKVDEGSIIAWKSQWSKSVSTPALYNKLLIQQLIFFSPES